VGGNFLKDLGAAAFVWITIFALAGGCNDPRSTADGAAAAFNEVSDALIGKQITIHGKFSLLGKVGPYVVLDNQQVIYLVSRGSFTWGAPYSEMEGKRVAATGVLRFFHSPDAAPADQTKARPPDYFYLEAETAQLRLISH
jgi:hypothetical protein